MWIYKITNKINGKAYVGRTKCARVNDRWKTHKSPKSGRGVSAIKEAILKYGVDNFVFETLIKASSEDELALLEAQTIQKLNTMAPHGYNLTSGGENYKRSPLAKRGGFKKGHVPWNKGLDSSDPRVARMVKTGKDASAFGNSYRKGVKHSEETKKKISEMQKGRILSEETKKKMSDSHMGKTHSEEAKANMSKSRDKQKISIKCLETGQIFSSISETAKIMGVNPGHIHRIINGKLKKSKGYTFEVVNAKRD
jgi:group I intron endonuclease